MDTSLNVMLPHVCQLSKPPVPPQLKGVLLDGDLVTLVTLGSLETTDVIVMLQTPVLDDMRVTVHDPAARRHQKVVHCGPTGMDPQVGLVVIRWTHRVADKYLPHLHTVTSMTGSCFCCCSPTSSGLELFSDSAFYPSDPRSSHINMVQRERSSSSAVPETLSPPTSRPPLTPGGLTTSPRWGVVV